MFIELSTWLIFFMMIFFLWLRWQRNLLFQRATERGTFPQLAKLTSRENALIYLGLVSGPLLGMFVLAPWILPVTLIALCVVVIFSFFILSTLNTVLSTMRQNKQLSLLFFIDPYWLLMAVLIIALELSFLNWIKEVTIYFKWHFLWFTIGYSILLFLVAIKLSLTIDDHQFIKDTHFITLALLDSMIVVLSVYIFLHLTLIMIYLLN